MAALLPHKELGAAEKNGRLCVLADGLPTESSAYRGKLLKRANPGSAALLAEDMVKARREERSEWVKGKNVVYIYHNMIDEASHTADTAVFPACEGAIQQIKNLVALMKLKVGRLEGNFIEGMACEGSCVQGAGCLIRSPRNKLDVEKHAKEAKDRGVVQAVSTAKGVEAPAPAKAAAKAEGKAEKA